MISFVDPRGTVGSDPDPYDLSDPLEPGVVIGLMANGFPDSDTFLEHIADAVGERLPGADFARFNKGNASVLASEEMLDEVTTRCAAVIAAYGH